MKSASINRTFWPALAALAGAFLLFEFTPLDLAVQDCLYDFEQARWWVNARDVTGRVIFYTGPKVAIIILGIALLALALGPASWRNRLGLAGPARRNLFVAILTLGSVPAFVGMLKSTTNVFCPAEIRAYGGDVPYVRVLECYPANDRPNRRGRCFPAGHASGGFALIGLVGLARTSRARMLAVLLSLGVGGMMGFYQMAKGAHYLSHTVVTALIAWVFFLGWRRLFSVAAGAETQEAAP
jgi:membrane-associated PAP2 superfamily phosphatase